MSWLQALKPRVVNLESTWGQPAVNLRSTWGLPGVNMGSTRGQPMPTRGQPTPALPHAAARWRSTSAARC